MSYRRTGPAGAMLLCAAVLTACATTPLVFPTAAAEALADRSIQAIWRGGAMAAELPPPPAADGMPPPLDASSQETTRLKTQMARRYSDLRPLFDSGAVGLTADGYVAVRDASLIPEDARNAVRSIVANENADRAALYRELATASRQSQWTGQIRDVFANRWIAATASGWWYQDANGSWKQR